MIFPTALLVGSASLDLLANYCIKRSKGFSHVIWGATGLAAIIVAFILLSWVLNYLPLGVAYSVWGSLGLLGTVALDRVFFKTRLGKQGKLGVAFIIIGIVCLQITSG